MSSKKENGIFAMATKLQKDNSSQYGVKGAKPGSPGYVKDGWKNAVVRAKEIYYRDTGKIPKKKEKKPSIIKDDERMNAHWLISLRQLKEKYHREGLKDIKPRAPKRSSSSTAPKRLPPVILSYGDCLSSHQRLPMARFSSSNINITKEDLEKSQKMVEEQHKDMMS